MGEITDWDWTVRNVGGCGRDDRATVSRQSFCRGPAPSFRCQRGRVLKNSACARVLRVALFHHFRDGSVREGVFVARQMSDYIISVLKCLSFEYLVLQVFMRQRSTYNGTLAGDSPRAGQSAIRYQLNNSGFRHKSDGQRWQLADHAAVLRFGPVRHWQSLHYFHSLNFSFNKKNLPRSWQTNEATSGPWQW